MVITDAINGEPFECDARKPQKDIQLNERKCFMGGLPYAALQFCTLQTGSK